MSITRFHAIVVIAVSVSMLAACGGDESQPKDTLPVATTLAIDTPRAPRPGDPDCPRDGTWKPCALLDRLVSSGLAPKVLPETTRVSFFDVPGLRYQVGRSALLTTFFFSDSIAAHDAASRIDTILVRVPGDSVSPWASTPHFFRTANLIAVFESDDERQVERMMLALTAGTP